VTDACASPRYRRGVDEARAVLARLDRIDALERDHAPAGVLLAEVRALLSEAEVWVRAERNGTEDAQLVLADARERLARPGPGVERPPARGEPIASGSRSPP
jgi:hypothetical protein